ncbi:MAG: hypothetical protein IT330_05505 [Anaerolineae bacterium]|nr:hypothetical protein [Anaerolineae bacterium]
MLYPALCITVTNDLRDSGFVALTSHIVVVPRVPSVCPYAIFSPGGNGPGGVGNAVGVLERGSVTVACGVGSMVGVSGGVGVGDGGGDGVITVGSVGGEGLEGTVGGGVTGVGLEERVGDSIGDWKA